MELAVYDRRRGGRLSADGAILAINAGSSSLKFGLFRSGEQSPVPLLSGSLTHLDDPSPRFAAKDADGTVIAHEEWAAPDRHADIAALLEWVEAHLGDFELSGGHRVVHGGRDFSTPVLIDDGVVARLSALTPLAPLHQPASLAPVRKLRALRPELPQVACFDTAFHHGLTPPVSRYGLPRALEAEGICKYGFHGLSYESIAAQLDALENGARSDCIVVAHLGSGASLCAMRDLASVDTTMGFTALDGLVMGTRPGALDPGILLYLQRTKGLSVNQLEHLLHHECGLLGVSGVSSDVATLVASDRPEAAEALDLFTFQVARQVAMMASTLGGLDRLVFTGGIGEHSPEVRRMIVDRLGWLGVVLDKAANIAGEFTLSSDECAVRVQCLPAQEELVIARHVLEQLRGHPCR